MRKSVKILLGSILPKEVPTKFSRKTFRRLHPSTVQAAFSKTSILWALLSSTKKGHFQPIGIIRAASNCQAQGNRVARRHHVVTFNPHSTVLSVSIWATVTVTQSVLTQFRSPNELGCGRNIYRLDYINHQGPLNMCIYSSWVLTREYFWTHLFKNKL